MQRIAAVLSALLAIGFVAVLCWELLDATIEEFVENNLTPTAVPIRVKWLYLAGPIGGFQMLLTAIFMAGEQIRGTARPRPADAALAAEG
jgi:TRAP-type C4-dicarboxylate transport system permease small subunit